MRLTNVVLAAVAASSVAAAPVLLVENVSNKNVGGDVSTAEGTTHHHA